MILQSSASFTVAAGTFSVMVKDAKNCSTTAGPITIGQPNALKATLSAGKILCHGGTTTLMVAATGGTAPYQFSIDGGTTWQASASFTVGAGTYTVMVVDANKCTAKAGPITIGQPTKVVITSVTPTNVECSAPNTGTITVVASGGTAPLQFSLDNMTWQSSNVFTALIAGSYTVYVRDANNCPAQTTTTIAPAQNCQPLQGCTLGYWKNHTDRWCAEYSTSTLYGSVFSSAPAELRDLTLLQALNLGGGGIYNLARQSVAALLSACHKDVNYAITVKEIIAGVNKAFSSGTAGTYATYLDKLNNAGCPLGGTPATTSARTSSSMEAETSSLDSKLSVSVFPNPVRDFSTVRFSSPVETKAILQVFSMDGKQVSVLFNGAMEAGKVYEAQLQLKQGNSGMYFYILQTDHGRSTGKILSDQ